jgi:hypothetical protein
LLDFGLEAMDWDAGRFYAELGERRTYLGGRGGGYGGHGGAHHKRAARPKVACGMPVLRLGLRELKGVWGFSPCYDAPVAQEGHGEAAVAEIEAVAAAGLHGWPAPVGESEEEDVGGAGE